MKHILVLALFALTFSTASAQTIGYGIPSQQRTQAEQHRLDSIRRDQERASYYIQKAANIELAIPIVGAAGGLGSYYLLKNGDNMQALGKAVAIGTGVAVLVMWIVQNRYRHKAGKLLERVSVEQNGISIHL